jgi:TolB-like protein
VPFEGDTPFTVGVKHKSELPPNPGELNAQIPPDLGRLVLKCLEKDKTKRYQSAADLHADLERIEHGIPTTQRTVPARKTLASREVTVTLRLRKLFVPALAALAVVLAGVFLWHPWSRRGAVPPPPAGRPSIAVVYFENDTGDEKLDHWRKGISDLLITDLTQSKYLKVLGGDRLFTILSKMGQLEARSFSSEVLKEVAAQGGVNHIARGSYSKAGDILRIDLTLQDARSGEPVATHRVEGKGEESIFAMVDELTKWTKTSLNLSAQQIAGDIGAKIGQVTTSSPEAYKLYSEGRQVFAAGQYQRSIEFMEKALGSVQVPEEDKK